MKTICIDARLISHPGIGRYIRSLLRSIFREKTDYSYALVGGKNDLNEFSCIPGISIRHCGIPIYGFKEALTMHRFYKDSDLLHIPHFNVPFITHPKLVVTIHDLIYFHVKDYSPFPGARIILSSVLERISKKAKHIIAVSNSTKEDCVKRFPKMRDKISVIYEACDPFLLENNLNENGSDECLKKYSLNKKYFLYVGSIREHKNVHGLIKAYEKYAARNDDALELVLAGKLDHRFGKKYKFNELLRNNPRLKHLGAVKDEELKFLYKRALCLVMPSFYEGFGLPVLEAMANGTPVIVSDQASLPEISGDAGLVFSPHQIDDLSRLLYNIQSDSKLRQDLIKRGLSQVQKFSWTKAARETLAVYDKVLR